jgi:predicted transcriptional regulator of viral defense system
MRTTAAEKYGGAGIALIEALGAQGAITFTIEEARRLARPIGVAEAYVPELLHRLNRAGLIQRIKQGSYVLAGHRVTIHPFVVGMALVERSAVSGWSALNYHGFTDQIPLVVSLTTTRRTTTPAMRGARKGSASTWEVVGLEFEIVTILERRFFGHEDIWLGEDRARIFDRERAVLDCFAMPRRFGGISEGLAIVVEHRGQLDPARLVAYAVRYGADSVARRVGFALEHAEVEPEILEPLRAIMKDGLRPLDPTRPSRGPIDRRWQLRNNLGKQSR